MKKTIIILTILALAIIGYTTYLAKGYIDILDELNKIVIQNCEITDQQMDLENELDLVEYQYSYDIKNLLESNKGCAAWTNLNETLKQIIK